MFETVAGVLFSGPVWWLVVAWSGWMLLGIAVALMAAIRGNGRLNARMDTYPTHGALDVIVNVHREALRWPLTVIGR
jgi:hypothetical protein